MDKVKSFFRADKSYRSDLYSFTIRDAVIAIVYYLVLLSVYYIVGHIFAVTKINLSVLMSIVLMLIPVVIYHRSIATIGINRRNLKPSLIVSCAIGGLFLISYTIVPCVIAQRQLLPAKDIAYNIFFYFVIIGLNEEISFRGFIQPRLFPLLKREWLTVLIGGILFVFMHYPFQMAVRQMTFWEYWPQFIENAPMQMVWHLVFTWLYRRYGNIFSSTVLHGLVDMSEGIFG
ncbi:MAG: CPBP family intramembrane metalloprotease [Oscillospiraceae bacterium]|nr:CPBP family intramembrane metalloprotease [Oscillospiraceae bacterium]